MDVLDLPEAKTGAVRVIDEADVLPVRVHPELPALYLDHVPDRAEQ